MTDMPDNYDLARQPAVLEERMNTMQADYTAAHERLRADMAQRDVRLLLAIAGMIAIATAVLGFLIRLPPAAG